MVGSDRCGRPRQPARLEAALGDTAPAVRLGLAEALFAAGRPGTALPALRGGLDDPNEWVRLQAANIADRLDERARPLLETLRARLKDPNEYVRRVAGHAVADLEHPGAEAK
jgi:hypothetical protein